jgi:hypothetical protein
MTIGRIVSIGVLACAVALAGGPTAEAETTVPRAVIQAGMKKAKCDVPLADAVSDAEPADLGKGLKLIEVYCWRAAYNFGSIFFAYPAANPRKARVLAFHSPAKNDRLVPGFSLSNPDFSSEAGVMRSAHKGRGVGDCGEIGEWKWNGKDFTLKDYWRKEECDGEPFAAEEGDAAEDKWRVYPRRNQR